MYEFEREIGSARGFTTFCGTDEAGRGPLAGPVYAAAVFLGNTQIEGLNDSKKLTPKRREILYEKIISSVPHAIAVSTPEEIDTINILEASLGAMNRAVTALRLEVEFDGVLVDGNISRGFSVPALAVTGGDAKCASIAAASILAKVARDREMCRLDTLYPGYGFAKHKGYPTKDHYAALRNLGPSPVHRESFLQKFYKKQEKDPIAKEKSGGQLGEDLALEFLEGLGHAVLARNFKSHVGEVDLITSHGGYLVFTEVKLRKSSGFAHAVEAVDRQKIQKIRRTAEFWLMQNRVDLQPRFDIIEVYLSVEKAETPLINHIIGAF